MYSVTVSAKVLKQEDKASPGNSSIHEIESRLHYVRPGTSLLFLSLHCLEPGVWKEVMLQVLQFLVDIFYDDDTIRTYAINHVPARSWTAFIEYTA
jgi:hypothetical protein